MSRALVMLSGGIDSAAALAWASQNYDELFAISFQYYLRPFREQLAVYRLLETFPAKLIEVPVPFLKEAGDSKHGSFPDVPQGYIPNRNMIFYSIASYYAEIHQCASLVGGHTAEDHEAFPDASAAFFKRLQTLMNEALIGSRIRIELPLAKLTKLEVVKRALEWNVPLQHTWSCYWDRTSPCGKCVSCQERAVAFAKMGIKDPLL